MTGLSTHVPAREPLLEHCGRVDLAPCAFENISDRALSDTLTVRLELANLISQKVELSIR